MSGFHMHTISILWNMTSIICWTFQLTLDLRMSVLVREIERKIIYIAYCQYITVELSPMMVVIFTHFLPAMSSGLTLWNRSSVLCAPHSPNTIYLKEKESEPTRKNNYKWRVTLQWMEHMLAEAVALVFSVSFTSESWSKILWSWTGLFKSTLEPKIEMALKHTVIPIEKQMDSNKKIRW